MLVIIGYNTDRNEKKDRTVDQASSQKRLDISMTIQSLSVSAFHLYLCAETLSGRDTKGLELQTSLGTASWLKKKEGKFVSYWQTVLSFSSKKLLKYWYQIALMNIQVAVLSVTAY